MDKGKWDAGIKDEIRFWRNWLPKHAEKYLEKGELGPHFAEMIGDKKDVSIADVGCGAISVIGYTWPTARIRLYPSDLLADEYKRLHAELGIKLRVPIEKQDMARLTYGDDTFDIVHCRNALDHSPDPYNAIKEMVRVCKPGGWIYLYHLVHVGKQLGYKGLHQWNIDPKDGDCVFWNREERFLLSECVDGFVTEPIEHPRKKYVYRVISKMQK